MNNSEELIDSEVEHMITRIVSKPFVGNYIVIAESITNEGKRALVVRSNSDLASHTELGMLTSAINRVNMIDQQGWQCDCGEDHE